MLVVPVRCLLISDASGHHFIAIVAASARGEAAAQHVVVAILTGVLRVRVRVHLLLVGSYRNIQDDA